MAFLDASYRVKYSGVRDPEVWEAVFQHLAWNQDFTSEIPTAVHTFQSHGNRENEKISEFIVKALSTDLVKGKPFNFQISQLSLGDGMVGEVQNHHIQSWVVDHNRKGDITITVVSVGNMARMHQIRYNRSHKGEKISDIVRNIIGEYDSIAIGEIEDCTAVPEFGILRQSNLTDYEFICGHLCPRAAVGNNAGFELSSIDGNKVNFTTPGYKATKFSPDVLQVLGVVERNNSWDMMARGGSTLKVRGFDHYRKKVLDTTLGPTVNPSYGEIQPTWEGERFDYVPLPSAGALNAWALARHRSRRYKAYTFAVSLKGSPKLKFPMIMDLSGSGFREADQQTGAVISVHHDITRILYTQLFICERDNMVQ